MLSAKRAGRFASLSMGFAIVMITTLVGDPSHATPNTGFIATPDQGVAGMSHVVSVVDPEHAGESVTIEIAQGSSRQSLSVKINRAGVGHADWVPKFAGVWTISASSSQLRSADVSIAAMPTFTQVALPTNPSAYRYMVLIATVETGDEAASGELGQVEGKVVFREAVRGIIGEAKVEPSELGVSVAKLIWEPPGVATYAISAEFLPSQQQGAAGAAYAASSSGLAYMTTAEDPKRVQLLMPQVVRVGRPAYVAVKVDEGHPGSVSLDIDGKKVSLDKPVDRGMVHFMWLPKTAGLTEVEVVLHELGLEPEAADGQRGLLSDLKRVTFKNVVTQTINVQEARPGNAISITPIVDGKPQTPWRDGQVVVYRAGSRIPLVVSTGDEVPVVFKVEGDCVIADHTLVTPVFGGGCLVTVRAPGSAVSQPGHLQAIVSAPVAMRKPAADAAS